MSSYYDRADTLQYSPQYESDSHLRLGMDPLGGGPLLALGSGAAAVKRRRVHVAIRVQAVKHHRVAFALHSEAPHTSANGTVRDRLDHSKDKSISCALRFQPGRAGQL